MIAIPSNILSVPVNGYGLAEGPLFQQLGPGRTLVAFVRHLG